MMTARSVFDFYYIRLVEIHYHGVQVMVGILVSVINPAMWRKLVMQFLVMGVRNELVS